MSSFVFSPLANAFAQTSTDSGSATSTPPPADSSGTLPSDALSPATAGSSQPGFIPPSISKPTQPLALSSPSGNGIAPSEQPVAFNSYGPRVDKNTGAFTFTYPIDVPPGRNNLQPNLSLNYSSQDTQLSSIFGEGWSMSIPSIQRLSKAGVDKLYSTSTLNYFLSSLDGELVATNSIMTTTSSAKSFQVDTNGTLTTNLQDYYKLEDTSDFWSSNNLAASGSVAFDAGRVNNAADFGANNTNEDLATTSTLGIDGSNASFACWVNVTTVPGNYDFAIQGNNSSKVMYYFEYYDAAGTKRLNFTRYKYGVAGGAQSVDVAYALATSTWYFLVGTYDGTNVRLYVNGVSQGSTAASGTGVTSLTTGYTIGGDGTGTQGNPYASAKVDECGVWSKALSSQEIADLYNGGSGQTMTTTTIITTVTPISSSYIARTETGSFNSYTFSSSTNQWTMTDKNGTQYTFGSTTDSRQSDPSNASNTFKWMLKQITDTNGNTVVYNYVSDSGQIYPSSTVYTGTATSTGIFEVDFLKQARADTATSSATGFGVRSQYRMSEIDAKVNGSWVRKYTLGYTAGDNASTSLLSTITESGENASGTVITLPTSTFTYQHQIPGWTTSSTWSPPVAFLDWHNNSSNGARIVDLNGNSLSGLLQGVTDNPNSSDTSQAWVDNGHGWTASSTWNPPVAFLDWYNNSTNGVQIADVNGDGLPDIVQDVTDNPNNPNGVSNAWINTGHGWVASSTWDPPTSFLDWYYGTDAGTRIVDLNGDGLPDIIQGIGNNPNASDTYLAWVNNGRGWAADTSWAPPVPFLDWYNAQDTGWRIADVNGDGLPDLVSGTDAYLNNGHGWTHDASYASPVSFWESTSLNHDDNGARIADVNGDGLPDIIQGVGDNPNIPGGVLAAYLNTGHGWVASSSWNPPLNFLDWHNDNDYGVRIADVNGKGLPDLLQGITDNPNASDTYLAEINNNNTRADLLTAMTYPQGGSSTIQYAPALQITNSSGTIVNYAPYPVYVVTQKTTNDGFGNLSTTTYQYASGTYYYASPTDKEFAGFGKVTETDSAGNVTKTYYDTGNGVSTSTGQYQDNFWKIGRPYRVEYYDNASNLYKKIINRWDSSAPVQNAAFVKLASTTESDWDGLGTHKDWAESYIYDNTTGNQTQKVQWGQVSANDDGTFNDTSTDDFTTNTTYATSTTGVIGKPSDVTVTDHGGSKVKETQYYYDNLALGSASLGNLTKESDWEASSTYSSSQNTYNGYGLVTVHLDPRNNTTTYAYDAYNLYPATTTNALSQTTKNQYDYSTGKTTQTIDPNGDTFKTVYDGLGRPLTMFQPDSANASTTVTSTVYVYTDTSRAVSVHRTDYMNATTSIDTYQYFDGLNRLIQTKKSAEDSGNYKATDRVYNNLGLTQKESLPYFATSSAKTSATTTATLFTNYTYDALKRVLTIGNAVGTTTNTYSNWKIATVDPRGKEKDAYDDAYGNLIQIDEHNGSSTYSTYYTYDGLKDLTKLTDALGNVRNFTYDGLGRRLTAQDLHASTSSTYGTWNYTYDDASNLTQQVDPKNQTTTFNYDGLNRTTSESFGGQTQIVYTYDTCSQGIGRLCVASTSAAVASDTYNGLGQISKETKTIGAIAYVTSYTYDWQGNQLTVTNPDNSVVQYTYNLAGLPETVAYKKNGGSFANVVTNFDYAPTDQPTVINYANSVAVTNTYDATKLYRLTQKVGALPSGGGNAQNTSYTYDANGNITQIADSSNSGAGRTVNYAYDDLNRLTNASTTNVSTTPTYSQTFMYDTRGNILTGPAGTYSYGATASSTYADPDAATSISTSATTTATVAFDAISTLVPSVASTTFTWSHTVTSSPNTALVLGVLEMTGAPGATQTSTGASYNGIAMSRVADVIDTTSTRMTIWYLANPPAGTHTISSTIATTGANQVFVAESFAGVSRVGVTSTAFSALNQTSSTITITSTNKNMIADFESNNGGSDAPSVATGQTQTYSGNTSGNVRSGGASYILATSSNQMANRWTYPSAAPFVAADIELVAATSTPTSTIALNYDNNGNLTSYGATTNTWDYRNRLPQSTNAQGTSTYAYDYQNARISLTENGAVTIFPNTSYNVMLGGAATSTKHIYANGVLIATVTDTQSPIQQATSNASAGTVLGTTLTSAPKAGDALILTYGGLPSTSTISSIAGGGVTWQKAVRSGTNRDSEIWYGLNSSGSGTQVSTTISSACQGTCMITVAEWSGIATSSALDSTSTRSGSGTITISPTSTTSNANDLIVATERGDNSSTLLSGPAGSFNALASAVPTVGNSAYDVVNATTSTSTSWTYAAVASYDSVIAAFKMPTSTPATSITEYMLHDNLGGTNVVTNASGTVVETLDYYPYLQSRMDTLTGSYGGEKRKAIGQEYDALSKLNYFNARFYDNSRGQFIGEDPMFWEDPKTQVLTDPQSLNTYSYSDDNPITKKDPSGKNLFDRIAGFLGGSGVSLGVRTAGFVQAVNPFYAQTAYAPGNQMSTVPSSQISAAQSNQDYSSSFSAGFEFTNKLTSVAGAVGALIPAIDAAGGATALSQLQFNQLRGAGFEAQKFADLSPSYPDLQTQVTLRTQSGYTTRADFIGRDSAGGYCVFECKSSAAAPLTQNQQLAFPEIEQSGATVVGAGKPGFPGGTQIPPTTVKVIRP